MKIGSAMKMSTRALLATVILLAGCATEPSISVTHRVPKGSGLAVVMFKDCDITTQADCEGSGVYAGSVFANVIAQRTGLHVVPLPRPVGPKVPLSDEAAVAYAKSKGDRYVINGEVQDYYRAARLNFRAQRASISVRVLNTSDGRLMASFDFQNKSATSFTTPEAMVDDMAKQVSDSITEDSKRSSKQRRGDFLIGGNQ
jgi:hypothetical protein